MAEACASCKVAATTVKRVRVVRAPLVGRAEGDTLTFSRRDRWKDFPACAGCAKSSGDDFRSKAGIVIREAPAAASTEVS